MITGINQQVCTKCRLCEDICMEDVLHFNEKTRTIEIKYPDDCCNCFDCYAACGVDAISFDTKCPPKFNSYRRWEQIKTALQEEEIIF